MIALFNPAYPYGKPQTYLPGGLLNLLSRLLVAGVSGSITDLNFCRITDEVAARRLAECDVIGFSVVGPPYIPGVIGSIQELRAAGYSQPVLVGGEGVARLEQADFHAWFGECAGVSQARNDLDIALALGISPQNLPAAAATSMVPALRQMTDSELARYLTREFCAYLSQGCAFSCAFCAADKGKKEQYRSADTLREEMEFICGFLRRIGHPGLEIYISNLDTFQSPDSLEASLAIIGQTAREHGLAPHIRGLATSKCTYLAIQKDPDLLARLYADGLRIVAFGADGASEVAWKREKKRHNVMSELIAAMAAVKQAGMTCEVLMVIGFPEDGVRTMYENAVFSIAQALKGAVIRPYLAKSRTPSGRWVGKDETVREDDPQVAAFRQDSRLLVNTDYAALGSQWTHPNPWQRWMSNAVYLLIIGLLSPFGRCPTSPLLAVPSVGRGRTFALWVNRMMPFDR